MSVFDSLGSGRNGVFNVVRFGFILYAGWFVFSARAQVVIQFDYSRSTGTFFDDPEKRAVLQAAADSITGRLGDSLGAIVPHGANSWSIKLNDPASPGSQWSVSNPDIASNTLVVYVGASTMDSTLLGQGGPGGWNASGFLSWFDAISRRGQSGQTQNPVSGLPTATDFAPWGGSIVFNSSANWYSSMDAAGLAYQKSAYDLYSVAVHELGHVFGIGTSDSWKNKVDGDYFTGTGSVSLYQGNVPLNDGADHWASGTTSYVGSTGASQMVSMAPSLAGGVREYFTELDFQALNDIGWQVSSVPEPAGCAAVAAMALVVFAGSRHWFSRRQ